jgi:hypothetical protein
MRELCKAPRKGGEKDVKSPAVNLSPGSVGDWIALCLLRRQFVWPFFNQKGTPPKRGIPCPTHFGGMGQATVLNTRLSEQGAVWLLWSRGVPAESFTPGLPPDPLVGDSGGWGWGVKQDAQKDRYKGNTRGRRGSGLSRTLGMCWWSCSSGLYHTASASRWLAVPCS